MKPTRAPGISALLEVLLITLLLLSGCVQPENPARSTVAPTSSPAQTLALGKCGDGICDEKEEKGGLCPQDCPSGRTVEPTATPTPAPAEIDYSMRFGIGGYIYPDIKRGEAAIYAATRGLDKLGMICLRHPGKGIAWYEVQPTRETWDFRKLDAVINDNDHPWIIPTYGMVGTAYPFNADFSEEYMSSLSGRTEILQHIIANTVDMNDPVQKRDAEAYVKKLVDRYKDQIRYWEIGGNEGLPAPERFDIITNTYPWIKETDPDSLVLITAICGDDDSTFSRNLDAFDSLLARGVGDYFDIANFHYYGRIEGKFEERLEERFDEYKAIMDKYEVRKPIWVTETSTSSHENSVLSGPSSEQRQARDIVKRLVIFSAKGAAKVFWYDYGELSSDDKFYGCSIVDEEGEPKPSYHTFKLIVEKLGHYESVDTLRRDDVRLYRFTTETGKPIFVAWAKSSQTVDLSQYIGKEMVLVTHIVEDRSTTSPATERVRADSIELSESPVFIE